MSAASAGVGEALIVTWRCYFETADGIVLCSHESFESEEAGALWARGLLEHPENFELEYLDGSSVPATLVELESGFSVELDD
jgi:hypothetical protein